MVKETAIGDLSMRLLPQLYRRTACRPIIAERAAYDGRGGRDAVYGTSYIIQTAISAVFQLLWAVSACDGKPGNNRRAGLAMGEPEGSVTNPPVVSSLKDDGYRGIWFTLGQKSEFGDKYSGGLGTYTANHVPMAIYSKEA